MADRTPQPLVNGALVLVALGVTGALVVWMTRDDTPHTASEGRQGTVSEPDVPVSFGPFEFDEAQLDEEWRREREALAEREIGPSEQTLIDEFHRINAQSLDPDITPTQVEALSEHLVVSVAHYIGLRGPRHYKALGWYLADEFEIALVAASRAAQQRGRPVLELLAEDTDESTRWRERLGNFFDIAERTGLADAQGRLQTDRVVALVLFRYRWFGFAQDYASLSLMTRTERFVFWRWRIEQARGLPLVQRLAMVAEIEQAYAPTIDPDAVRGILYYNDGHFEQARAHFRRARRNHPEDSRYPVWEQVAARRAGAE